MTRKYSSISVETSLAAGLSSSATTMTVAAGTAATLLGGVTLAAGNVDIFTVALDVDTLNEEIVYVTGVSGDTLTIVRGRAGTSAISHTGGATVKHVLSSDDLTTFEATTTSAVTLTGTQTLTNKTLTAPTISTIKNSGTLTLPTLTDTVVARTTTDTLTNKTLTDAKLNLGLNAQTGTTYTLVAADQDEVVTLTNAAGITLTVPPSVFSAGQTVNLAQLGAGQVTVAAGAGVTVNSSSGLKLRAQYSTAVLICVAANTFLLAGDLTA